MAGQVCYECACTHITGGSGDLASAFDTIEPCVLLEQLSHAGIKGKCWRLIRNWYKNLSSQVRLGSCLSKHFPIECGVRQGSVLSTILFNLVMDPLLADLKSRNLGLSIYFLGAFAHADDIRTTATNAADSRDQISTIQCFTKEKGLQLCVEKCGIVITRRNEPGMGFHYPWSDCLFKTQSSALEYGGVLTPPVRNQLKNGYAKHVLPFFPGRSWLFSWPAESSFIQESN